MNPHLSPSRGEFRVPPNTALDIVLTFSVSAQVDGVWVYMDVHEVVDNLTLNVVLNTVYQVPAAHIHHLNEREISGKRVTLMVRSWIYIYKKYSVKFNSVNWDEPNTILQSRKCEYIFTCMPSDDYDIISYVYILKTLLQDHKLTYHIHQDLEVGKWPYNIQCVSGNHPWLSLGVFLDNLGLKPSLPEGILKV